MRRAGDDDATVQGLYEKTLACVHCGLCLPACPAYGVLGRESVAPRGQVYNVRALLEGRLAPTRALAEEVDECLACRGCESVCPAGVPVGRIVEEARSRLVEAGSEPWTRRLAKRWLLGGLLASPAALGLALDLLRWYEASGLRRVLGAAARRGGRRARRWAETQELLPPIPPRAARRPLDELWPAEGRRRGRVALFTGCIAAHVFADVNRATARVLQRNGFDVVVPRAQRCCGALALHNGLADVARRLLAENARVFAATDAEAVVVNAAGCGTTLKEAEALVGPSGRSLAARAVDVAAFLAERGLDPPPGPLPPTRVAYDPPCHLFHGQGVRDEPRALLGAIEGVELVAHRDAERCCGSAGVYNVTHFDVSMEVLAEKMARLAEARPDVIASGNPGCLLQLAYGVRKAGLAAEVVHPIVLLDRAYGGSAAAARG